MVRFLDLLKKLNVNVTFLEILKEVPSYLKFLKGLLSTKGEPEKVSVVVLGKVCSATLQRGSLSKMCDPSSFFILCSIGDMPIERALCDLGASVSLMSLSLCKKVKLLYLKPATTSIQFADCSIK